MGGKVEARDHILSEVGAVVPETEQEFTSGAFKGERMIPTIGLMVGGYIIMRCVDVLCRPSESFGGTPARSTMQVLAVLLILLTGSCVYDLYTAASTVPVLGR